MWASATPDLRDARLVPAQQLAADVNSEAGSRHHAAARAQRSRPLAFMFVLPRNGRNGSSLEPSRALSVKRLQASASIHGLYK